MARANSLKKAVLNVIDMTEKEVDTQAEVTTEVHTHMLPVHEESSVNTCPSPNLSPYSSLSSIDSGRRESFDVGPTSLNFEPRTSVDSGPRGSIDSGDIGVREARNSVESLRRTLELGLCDPEAPTHGRQSTTSHGSVVEPAP